jgi:AcrR family transcriptional regulator
MDDEDSSVDAGDDAPVGRRAQRRAFRRDEILRTALELVTESGIDGVTTTELAKRTGAALGALYRFFPSKQAVIAALQERALFELGEDLQALSAATRGRAEGAPARVMLLAQLIAVADGFFAQSQKHPARFRLIDEIMSKPVPVYSDDDAKLLEGSVQPILMQVGALAAAWGTLQPDRGAEAAALPMVLWGSLHGVSHFIKRDRLLPADAPHSHHIAASLLHTLLLGLGASVAELSEAWRFAAPSVLASTSTSLTT